jgi:hypothetical protein
MCRRGAGGSGQPTGPLTQMMRSCSRREKMSNARSPRGVVSSTMGMRPIARTAPADSPACKPAPGLLPRAPREAPCSSLGSLDARAAAMDDRPIFGKLLFLEKFCFLAVECLNAFLKL